MEDDLVPGHDGYYCLCIHGVASMSEDAILDIFNQYGEVVRVNRAGGLAFCRYQEYEEAKAALEKGKEDNPDLHITMAHNKNTGAKPKNDYGRNFCERNNTDERGDGSRNFGERNNTDGRGDGSRNFGERNNTDRRGDDSRNFGERNNTDRRSGGSRNFGERAYTDGRGDGSRNSDDRNNVDGRGDGSRNSNDRNNQNRYENVNGLRRPRSKEGETDDGKDSMPALKFTEKVVEGMPDLVPRGEPAKQLIIANLPRSIMQYQVFNLCKSRGALHVDIFTTSSNITYAHVHVKDSADVDALEMELNGLVIDDSTLAVISTEKLLAEHSAPGKLPITSGKK